ncbi:hypothetical protein SDC9_151698 [bioreactor metagenome]|uniref:Uncharacterized protein n=1 Tax=bioreactor metagenome TaxID=1076179 RepID=A0A645ESS3_9ZZZZ
MVAGAPGVAALRVLQLLVGGAHHHAGLVVIHQVQRQVQGVGADVDERTAALLVFVQEHAPVGGTPTADGKGLGVVDVPQIAPLNHALQIVAFCLVAVLIPDGQLFARFVGGFHHAARVGGGLGHGLFAHHMLSGMQCVNGDIGMGTVGGAYMHHVDGSILQQFPVVLIHLGLRRSVFLCRLFRFVPDKVAESHQVHPVKRLQGRHVFPVGNAAAADDPHAKTFFHSIFLRA